MSGEAAVFKGWRLHSRRRGPILTAMAPPYHDAPRLTAGLGFRAEGPGAQGVVCYALPERRKRKMRGARPAVDPDSPFARLSELRFGA